MSIRFKVFGVIILLSLMLAGISYFALFITMDILSKSEHIYADQLVSITSLTTSERNLSQSLNDALIDISDLLYEGEDIEVPVEELVDASSELRQSLAGFYETYSQTADFHLVSTPYDRVLTSMENLTESINSLSSAVSSGDNLRAYNIFRNDTYRDIREIVIRLSMLTAEVEEHAASNYTLVRQYGFRLLVFYNVYAAAGILVGLLILWLIHSSVLKPIKTVSDRAAELSGGEGDLSYRLPVRGNDEMAELSVNFNSFLAKTESLVREVKNAVETATALKTGTVLAVEENKVSVGKIAERISSIGSQGETLDSEVSGARNNVLQVNESVQTFEKQVVSQASMSEESTAAVTEMIASTSNLAAIASQRSAATETLSKTLEEGNDRILSSTQAVQAIHEDVDTILELLGLISGIAEQTNILSMNAAIEAAHAGDAGRGFAVVADEIRKLAETSGTQSNSIKEVLSRMIRNIEDARESSLFSVQIYSQIQDEFNLFSQAFSEITSSAQELTSGGQQVLQAMHELNDQSQDVRRETSQIKESSTMIAEVFENIKTMSDDLNAAVQEINSGMSNIKTNMMSMTDMSEKLDVSMNDAAKQLNRFHVTEVAENDK